VVIILAAWKVIDNQSLSKRSVFGFASGYNAVFDSVAGKFFTMERKLIECPSVFTPK
jgi:hypothetical protein